MSDLKLLPSGEWLGDHDSDAWDRLINKRGGCRCHLAPPCFACYNPMTEAELNSVGFTYGDQEGGAA